MTSFRAKILSAGLWSGFDAGLRFGVQFGVSIVLARILSPTDFGIYALTAVFIALSSVLVDGGFCSALVQRAEISRAEETAVFWYNGIAAFVLGGAIAAMAPSVARMFGHPVLEHLLYVSAIIVPINAMAAVPGSLMQRHLRFDLLAKSGLTASVLSGLLAVVLAINGVGIWTFAWQALAHAVINVVLLWLLSGWRPLRGTSIAAARPLVRFGFFLSLSNLLEVAYQQGFALVIGKLYGARDLGYFNRGQNLQILPANVLTLVITRVTLPVLSTKSDPAELRSGVQLAQGVAMMGNLPLMGALVAMPDLIIDVLYGPKWLPAAPILRILAIGGLLIPMNAVNVQMTLARGRSELYLKTEMIKKAIGILIVCLASIYGGVIGLAVSQAAFLCLSFAVNATVSGRFTGYSPFEQLWDLRGPALLTLAMVALIGTVKPFLEFGSLINIAILSVLGGAFFVSTALLLRVGATNQFLALLPSRRVATRKSAP
ncbi:lipopolysaccharide biosynthesis protein [Sphingomonas sp. ACRSK]|uniref:lipopolysaccharide biosynthesis protein n=1 Tax=Sphingomonas sp. ACRSK TaxID=2918213 RepID=UPI001EF74EB7|nr:lipopolysaccharide biosynthesis protein [Sphingomonas sp. ACRSK]MCG7349505.1 lipopolysaccharide biosynthesis protein [Sphingomonas sp. ACRSK]